MVRFSNANSKLKKLYAVDSLSKWLDNKRKVYSFDMLSGHNCPFANECLSKAMTRDDGTRYIEDGDNTQFRCFSASQEAQYPNVYKPRKENSDAMRAIATRDNENATADLLCDNMPDNLGICRIHVAGDFFNQVYFDAWILVAKRNPDKLFYAYTKSLPFWVARLGDIPDNFVLTASRGGLSDDLIEKQDLREALVVFDENYEALPIDDDDSHAAIPETRDQSFALLIHGSQPKGSDASKALQTIKRNRKAKQVA